MEGILPAEAAERLGRCQEQYEEHRRKQKAFDMGARLQLVYRCILVALPEENHRVSCEDLVELQDCHVDESTSCLVAKFWKIKAAVSDRVVEGQEILKVVPPRIAGSIQAIIKRAPARWQAMSRTATSMLWGPSRGRRRRSAGGCPSLRWSWGVSATRTPSWPVTS